MDQKPTPSNGHESSVQRRETLRRLARSLGVLLFTAPLITRLRHFLPTTVHAATETLKGQPMNPLSPHSTDPFRLPRHVLPTRYELRLEPDLTGASFHGRVAIAVTVVEPTDVIVLNALELAIEDATVEDASGRRQPASVILDEPSQRLRLTVPGTLAPRAMPPAHTVSRHAQRQASRLLPEHLQRPGRNDADYRRNAI